MNFVMKLVIVFHFIYVFVVIKKPHFLYTQIHSMVIIICLILPLYITLYRKSNVVEYKNQIITILFVSICLTFIYSSKISLSVWFNYHDISHLIIGGLLFMLYKNICKLSNKKEILK